MDDIQALHLRLSALEAGLSRREPIAGGDYGRADPHDLGAMASVIANTRAGLSANAGAATTAHSVSQRLPDDVRTFTRDLSPDTRGDSATGFTRQEQRRVSLTKGLTIISVLATEGSIRALELDGWLPS